MQSSQGTITTGNSAGDTRVAVAVGDIPAGGQVLISFRVTVNTPLAAGVTRVANQAVAAADNLSAPLMSDDPDTRPPGDATLTPVTAAPVLAASKSARLLLDANGDGIPNPGDTLLYRVVVGNRGNAPALNLGLTDTPDAFTTLVVGSVQSSQGTVTRGNGAGDSRVEVSLGVIPGGGQALVTFHVQIVDPLPPTVTTVRNQAAVTADNAPSVTSDDPATAAADDPTVTSVSAAPRIQASKRADLALDQNGDGTANPGDQIIYAIVIGNGGNTTATGVTFIDTPDGNTRLVSGSVTTTLGTVTRGNDTGAVVVQVDVGDLAPGGRAVIRFRVTVNDPVPTGVTTAANQGIVSGGNFPATPTDDPATGAVSDPTLTPISQGAPAPAPLISSVKRDQLLRDADGSGTVTAGDTLLYGVTIRNTGTGSAIDLVYTDTPDANTVLINGTVQTSLGTVITGNGGGEATIRVAIGDLAPGGTVNLSYQVRINDPLPVGVIEIRNQGMVSGNNIAPVMTDDPDFPTIGDPTSTTVTAAALVLTKGVQTPNNVGVEIGQTITYTLVLRNVGTQAVSSALITDAIPAGTSFVPGSALPPQSSGPDPLVWTVPSLAVGASVTVSFGVRVDTVISGTTAITNVAAADSAQTPSLVSNPVIAPYSPTAVELLSFRAVPVDVDALAVEWVTGSEIDTWGFHLWRSADGRRENAIRITAALIPAQGGPSRGASYRFVDRPLVVGVRYEYWLQEMELDGDRNEYGPIQGQWGSVGPEEAIWLHLPLISGEAIPAAEEEGPTEELPVQAEFPLYLPAVER